MEKAQQEIRVLAYYNWEKNPERSAEENWMLAEKQWLESKSKECKNKIKLADLYNNFSEVVNKLQYLEKN